MENTITVSVDQHEFSVSPFKNVDPISTAKVEPFGICPYEDKFVFCAVEQNKGETVAKLGVAQNKEMKREKK